MDVTLNYENAWELYQALKEEAEGGQDLTWTTREDGKVFDPGALAEGFSVPH